MLCVIAKLDDASTEKLEMLSFNSFTGYAETKPLHGHITIASYIGHDEERFISFCKDMMDRVGSFPVEYEKTEVLEETSIIVAVPSKTDLLDSMHQIIVAQYDDSLDLWTRNDKWYPHTTLLYSPEMDLHALCRKMMESFKPISAKICRIEFSHVLEDSYEIVDGIDLSSR